LCGDLHILQSSRSSGLRGSSDDGPLRLRLGLDLDLVCSPWSPGYMKFYMHITDMVTCIRMNVYDFFQQ